MGWNKNDLTVATKAPLATFRPVGYVYVGQGSQHVLYEGFNPGTGSDGHVHELYWDGSSWHHHDLSADAGGPPIGAGSVIAGYNFNQPDTIYGTQHAIYIGTDSHVHELWYSADSADGWHHHDLSAATGAPAAINGAFGEEFSSQQHVFFEGRDLHIHELVWDKNGGWSHEDLTKATGAGLAAAAPRAYVFYEQGTEHVVYLGTDGHVHELWWQLGQWHHNDLTQRTNAPLATDPPAGCSRRGSATQHVGFRANDGHIHLLFWINDSWTTADLHGFTQAPQAAPAPLEAYAFDAEQTVHFDYLGTDGGIHELWFAGQDWHHNGISAATGAPSAISSPSGWVFNVVNPLGDTQHVVYTDVDHHVIELWWRR
jgi:hypothetical protein